MARFRDALAAPAFGAIAEVKRRSPSAGDLRPDADPARLALQFANAGAAAVSILVDERFGGTLADLQAARDATPAPWTMNARRAPSCASTSAIVRTSSAA